MKQKHFRMCYIYNLFFALVKPDFRYSSLSFVGLNWGRIKDKLAIN